MPSTFADEENESDDALLSCEDGGWGGDASDDEYGGLPLVPRPPPRTNSKPGNDLKIPPLDEYRLWLEDIAYQVGNAAHEIRNALRYWSSLVSEAGTEIESFKQADNTSGKLEATMRALVGKVRNVDKLPNRLGKHLAKGRALLEQIKNDLSVLGGQSMAGVQEQRSAIDDLISRQDAYLTAMESAHMNGDKVAPRPTDIRLALPAPGKRIDFGTWSYGKTEAFVARMVEAVHAQEPLEAEEVIGLARLVCNQSHEIQNLSVAPHGGAGSEAHQWLKQLDGLAGKCENAARAAMVFAHRWYITQSSKLVAKLVNRAEFLLNASSRGKDLLAAAQISQGAQTVSSEALALTLSRVANLAQALHDANLQAIKKDKKVVAKKPPHSQRCLGCSFAVTGISPQHCCNACKKDNGRHGGRCQKMLFVESSGDVEVVQAQKCGGCEFVVTGVLPRYCCGSCKKNTGKHGSRCQKILFADVSVRTNASN